MTGTTERERVRETCFAATEAVKRGDVEPGEAVRQIMESVDDARLEDKGRDGEPMVCAKCGDMHLCPNADRP